MVFHRYDIHKADIFRGVNDTTNSALRAGQLLTDGRNVRGLNTCVMHTQELVITHALGLRTRTRMRVVVDEFCEGKALRNRVKELLSFIMDKKAKGRFREYCNLDKAVKTNVLELPNDTRVAGTYRMFVSCLKSKQPIQVYCAESKDASKVQDLALSTKEWQQLAEFEAVLKHCHILAMESQIDGVGPNSFAYYTVANCRWNLKNSKSFNVVNVRHNWNGDKTILKVPTVLIDRDMLMPCTLVLLKRLDDEFKRYFAAPDADQQLLMFFHPLMIWQGFS